jgi:hypothetical protein
MVAFLALRARDGEQSNIRAFRDRPARQATRTPVRPSGAILSGLRIAAEA